MENDVNKEKNYFTYGMIKPDGMPHIKEILELIYNSGLYVTYSKVDTLDEKIIEENYPHCIGKDFYEGMKENLLSDYVLKMLILDPKGDAVTNYRKILGKTKSWEADPDTIRGKFGDKKIAYKNVAHGSGNALEAEDEIIRFFKGDLNNVFESVLIYGSSLAMSEFIKSNINDSTIVNKAFRDANINEILNDYSKKMEK